MSLKRMTDAELDGILDLHQGQAAARAGKRIRVTRVITYEGDYEVLRSQLGRSLPDGKGPAQNLDIQVYTVKTEVIDAE